MQNRLLSVCEVYVTHRSMSSLDLGSISQISYYAHADSEKIQGTRVLAWCSQSILTSGSSDGGRD